MDIFKQALQFIFDAEGLLSDRKNDRGGLTKFGISKKYHPNLDIANLTLYDAENIYYQEYWLLCKCDLLPPQFAIIVFGSAVNHGPERAIKLLQKTLRVGVDGIIGQHTLSAAKAQNNRYMLGRFFSYRGKFYMDIVLNDQSQYENIRGWLRRLFNLQQFILEVTHEGQ